MITEDYVSFETAKLLKEKGFDVPCYSYYVTTKTLHTTFHNRVHVEEEPFFNSIGTDGLYEVKDKTLLEDVCSAPTHQMTLKWLRKAHKIVLHILFEPNQGWTFYVARLITETLSDGSTHIVDIQHCVWSNDIQQLYYKEYEQAVEAALLYVLKNLI